MKESGLFRLRELSDLFVDACVRDPERGELLFLSIFGRDGSLQQFFAALTLKPGQGGFREFTLLDADDKPSTVYVSNADVLDKHTGKLPPNLFGNMAQAWLYDKHLTNPDRANGRAWVLIKEGQGAGAPYSTTLGLPHRDDDKVWQRLKDLSAVPLAEEWRTAVMREAAEAGGFITWFDDTSPHPPLGGVQVCRLTLGAPFVEFISALVKARVLRVPGEPDLQATAPRTPEAKAPVFASPELLDLGQVVMTAGVEALEIPIEVKMDWLRRHRQGDWGIVGDDSKRMNVEALRSGEDRLMSAYAIDPSQPSAGHGDNTVWVITEWDRSVTTILLPEEY
jgi:hypothetical protein